MAQLLLERIFLGVLFARDLRYLVLELFCRLILKYHLIVSYLQHLKNWDEKSKEVDLYIGWK